jgi:hypothetical protein
MVYTIKKLEQALLFVNEMSVVFFLLHDVIKWMKRPYFINLLVFIYIVWMFLSGIVTSDKTDVIHVLCPSRLADLTSV